MPLPGGNGPSGSWASSNLMKMWPSRLSHATLPLRASPLSGVQVSGVPRPMLMRCTLLMYANSRLRSSLGHGSAAFVTGPSSFPTRWPEAAGAPARRPPRPSCTAPRQPRRIGGNCSLPSPLPQPGLRQAPDHHLPGLGHEREQVLDADRLGVDRRHVQRVGAHHLAPPFPWKNALTWATS